MAAVPSGTLSLYGRPHGLSILARAGEESKLLDFMGIFERTFPKRPVPPMLAKERSVSFNGNLDLQEVKL